MLRSVRFVAYSMGVSVPLALSIANTAMLLPSPRFEA